MLSWVEHEKSYNLGPVVGLCLGKIHFSCSTTGRKQITMVLIRLGETGHKATSIEHEISNYYLISPM